MITDNPYVGLRPFETDESLVFFGRNDQVHELLQRLHDHHFVAVIGSSGCGKSSLLRAGLIPALKAGFLIADTDSWNISIMKPGQNPLFNLAEALLSQVEKGADEAVVKQFIQDIREKGKDTILEKIRQNEEKGPVNFFLLVDQFEELFRISLELGTAEARDEVNDFVSILLELAKQADLPFFVVITMRSDFIGDCSQFYGLPEAMNESLYLVPKLTRMQLRTVIEGPAKLFGGKLNPSITSFLLNELDKVKDELPLLQHALMRMWDYEIKTNHSGEIDFTDYEQIGGIEGALSRDADNTLKKLDESDARLTKTIFQALTTIDDNGRKIRRPVRLKQLSKISRAEPNKILEIINHFNQDKRSFLVVNKTGVPDDFSIDISHESLIRQWTQLSNWVDEEEELASTFRRLIDSAELYASKKKDLLSGVELQSTRLIRVQPKVSLSWARLYRLKGYEAAMNYLRTSEDEELRKVRRKEIKVRLTRIIIAATGTILLVLTAYYLFIKNQAAQKSFVNQQVTEKIDSITKEMDSTLRFKDSLRNLGLSNARIDTYNKSDLDKFARMNKMITALEKRADTTFNIEYFPKLSDEDKAIYALRKLGFKVAIKNPTDEMSTIATNAIWIGRQANMKPENVKLIALYLIRAGIKIRSIRQFDNPNGDKSRIIQIGAGRAYLRNQVWTIDQVMHRRSFDGDGRP